MNLIEKIVHSKTVIRKAYEKYDKIIVASSMGKDSIVMLDLVIDTLLESIDDEMPEVFYVWTPFKPPGSKDFVNDVEWFYCTDIGIYSASDNEVGELYETDPDECCRRLKVEPFNEAIEGYDCVITGLRNTEGETRKDYKEEEDWGDFVKINPLLLWEEREIWQYIAMNGLPVHPAYKEGYRSLGCSPCTKLVGDDKKERDGRWAGTSKVGGECGIHTKG